MPTTSGPNPRTIAITGIQAAGKSTVARLLAQRFERGVHIEADVLYQMIVTGRVLPEEPGIMPPEGERQLRLRLRNACLLALFEAGFTPVIDDIIIGERYDHLKSDLEGLPFTLIVLAPRPEVVIAARDADRGKRIVGKDWARYLDGELRATMAGNGIWIDNSDRTPEETVDEIARRLGLEATA